MTRIAPLLLCCAAGLAAVDAPVTPPAEPPPEQAAEQTAGAQPAPPPRRVGTRIARVAAPAPTWDGRLRLGAGWDSNALLDSDPDTAQAATADYTGEAAMGWRPVADQRDYLRLNGSFAYSRRPHLDELDTARLSLGVAGARQGESVTTGGSLSAARYWLDGDGAAAEVRGGASLAWLRPDSADLLAIELAVIHFDEGADRPEGAGALGSLGEADDRSGTLAALSWRHWWQLGGGNRVEAGVRAGRYFANSEPENYLVGQPWVGLRLRPEGWDVNARAAIEARTYDSERSAGEDAETSLTGTFSASADRRFGSGLWAGAITSLSSRDSSYDNRDYERWTIGLRLTWTFQAED